MGLPPKSRIRAIYERIADSFAASRREAWPEVVAFLEGLPRTSCALDLGCGNGRHARILAERGHAVLAVDFSRRLLVVGRDACPDGLGARQIAWIEGEATRLPIRSERVDACLCVAVLHHLPTPGDRLAALREVRRVLVPGGKAFLSVWTREQPRFARGVPDDGDVEVPWTLPDGTVVGRPYHLFREGELASLIIESSLRMETFFRAGGNDFVLAERHD